MTEVLQVGAYLALSADVTHEIVSEDEGASEALIVNGVHQLKLNNAKNLVYSFMPLLYYLCDAEPEGNMSMRPIRSINLMESTLVHTCLRTLPEAITITGCGKLLWICGPRHVSLNAEHMYHRPLRTTPHP